MSHPSRPAVAGLAVSAVVALTCAVPATGAPPAGSAAPAAAAAPAQPNIVFVMADDLGWADLSTGRTNGGRGNDFHDTPAIDRLAEEGMSFPNAYACLNCAPTRMALMTGLDAPRPANNIFTVGGLNRGRQSVRRPLLVGPSQGRADGSPTLSEGRDTVAETLQDAGYRTGYVGKFHVARSPEEIVGSHGFDENLGGGRAGNATRYHAADGRFDDSVTPTLDPFAADYTQEYVDEQIKPYARGVDEASIDALVGTDKHVTDAVGDATIDFIDRNAGDPFFTFVGQYALHAPLDETQPRTDLLEKYQAKLPGSSPARPSYAALAEGLDQSVGRIVEHLESTPDPRNPGHPLADNTLVVFTSDNGGRDDVGGFNGPLRGQKGEILEGGVRVPWVAWSANPALVRGGTVNPSPINGTDLHPTLADLGGARLGVRVDGTSLRGAFARGERVTRPLFAHLPGYLRSGGRAQRPESSVRSGRWKLYYGYERRSWTLYDLKRDLGETTNLAARRPRLAYDLGVVLMRWLNRTKAPLATLPPTRGPMVLRLRGSTYADGRTRRYPRLTRIVVRPGREVPLVLRQRR